MLTHASIQYQFESAVSVLEGALGITKKLSQIKAVSHQTGQDLSAGGGGGGGVGGMVVVGDPIAGLPPAELLFGNTTGLGLVAGGLLSLKEEPEADKPVVDIDDRGLLGPELLLGRKVEGMSLAELALRCRGCWEESASRSRREWSGLEGSDAPPLFSCSRVSSTTSGACLTLLCLSSSRSSLRAVFIVASMS